MSLTSPGLAGVKDTDKPFSHVKGNSVVLFHQGLPLVCHWGDTPRLHSVRAWANQHSHGTRIYFVQLSVRSDPNIEHMRKNAGHKSSEK